MFHVFIVLFASTCLGSGIVPLKFKPLPVGSINPQGWLNNELVLEAHSLAGHLPRFWNDIQASSWIGGSGDTGLHERLPYWLNGIVPLLFQIPNSTPKLREQVDDMIATILNITQTTGVFGPQDNINATGQMYWGRFDMILALQQYAEGVGPGSLQTSILKTLNTYLTITLPQQLATYPMADWSAARWQDLALGVVWMYENYSDATTKPILLKVLTTIQTQGLDWAGNWFVEGKFPNQSVPPHKCNFWTHGVNNGQAMKVGAVTYRFTNNTKDLAASDRAHALLQKYHGQATGMFGCDEHLAGRMPSRGTELCTVVETMFSYEVMWTVTGNRTYLDYIEKIAYNALPGEMTADMWAHQYLQEVNQFQAVTSTPRVWVTDGPNSTLFGLEPNYGCCTANFDQGWSKFVSNLLHITEHGDLYLTFLAPYVATVPLIGKVSIVTDYPFDNVATISIEAVKVTKVIVHIPASAVNAKINVQGQITTVSGGSDYTLTVPAGITAITVTLQQKVTIQNRYNNSASVYYGPLLFAIHPQENFQTLAHWAFDSNDYAIVNGSQWNYGLLLNNSANNYGMVIQKRAGGPSPVPFSTADPPILLIAQGALAPEWGVQDNAAAAPPLSPLTRSNPLTSIVLYPYGATRLRLAEVPYYQN